MSKKKTASFGTIITKPVKTHNKMKARREIRVAPTYAVEPGENEFGGPWGIQGVNICCLCTQGFANLNPLRPKKRRGKETASGSEKEKKRRKEKKTSRPGGNFNVCHVHSSLVRVPALDHSTESGEVKGDKDKKGRGWTPLKPHMEGEACE